MKRVSERHYWFAFPTKLAAQRFLERLRETDKEATFDVRPDGTGWIGRVATTRRLHPTLKSPGPWGHLVRWNEARWPKWPPGVSRA